jgi:DNA-binding CsgD family transcriptional regulator/tetratricopeptide (TPR) repeat protein
MERLDAALVDAMAGEGRMLMLAGEPGIGKTRTAKELAHHALELGAEVLWGGCYEGEGAPLLWPWAQVLREYAQARPATELRRIMGPRGSVISATFSDMAERLPGLDPPAHLDDLVSARFRLFDAFCGFLNEISLQKPLVIVLDDLHWADVPSLLLLEFLAPQLHAARILLLGTYRDVELGRMHPLQRTLGDLTRQRLFERVALHRLGVEEVRLYMMASPEASIAGVSAEVMHERTDGNPLFVTEIMRLLSEEGGSASVMVRVPEGVKETIGRRMDRLPARCNEVLRGAALLGRRFHLRTLERVVEGIGTEEMLELIGGAEESRIVEVVPGVDGQYRFTHALTQQTLAEEVPLARRVRLHARIVEALEAQYGAEAAAKHPEELVEHCAKAEPVLGNRKLVKYLLAAGNAALTRYAIDKAEEYCRRGLEAKGEGGPADTEMADLHYGLGRARMGLLDDAGIESLAMAFDCYVEVGLKEKAVTVAVDPVFWRQLSRLESLSEICRRAMELVEPGTRLEAEVLAKLGYAEYYENGGYEACCSRFERALEIARREGDTAIEMRVLAYWSAVDSLANHFQEALEKSDRAYRLAMETQDLGAQAMVLGRRVFCRQLLCSTIAEREPDVERFLQVAERLKDRRWLVAAYLSKETIACEAGRWNEAMRLQDKILEIQPDYYQVYIDRCLVQIAMGILDSVERLLRQVVAGVGGKPKDTFYRSVVAEWIGHIAFLTGSSWPDLFELAEELAAPILTNPKVPSHDSKAAEVATWWIGIARGDTKACAGFCARAAELSGSSQQSFFQGLLPLLERVAGRIEESILHFRDSVEEARRQGMPALEARWLLHLGETLLLSGGQEERGEAVRSLSRSIEISQEYGMPLLERTARAALEKADQAISGALGPTHATRPGGLTGREAEVLQLLACGKTNKEIGFDLFISPKTVGTHVQSILHKIGATNRTEAASYAIRNNLVKEELGGNSSADSLT